MGTQLVGHVNPFRYPTGVTLFTYAVLYGVGRLGIPTLRTQYENVNVLVHEFLDGTGVVNTVDHGPAISLNVSRLSAKLDPEKLAHLDRVPIQGSRDVVQVRYYRLGPVTRSLDLGQYTWHLVSIMRIVYS